jgi:UDP-GlcNAc:undecaprenyl-phosphate GlcNAc-1-phosphate transferase
MIFLILIPIFFLTTYLFLRINYNLAKYIQILDLPNKRKKHSKPTPLTGGILFAILLFESVYFIYFQKKINFDFELYIFPSLILLFGLLDDKKDLNANIKLLILTIIYLTFLSIFPEFQIKNLNFLILEKKLYLGNLSIFFTALCILLLINASNMSDGINGLFLGTMIIYFYCLSSSYEHKNILLILTIIILVINFILNIKEKFFMGDSGVFFISTLLSIEIIKAYNSKISNLKSVEEIFLILMIPGVDMFRLFCVRLNSKRNPFKADNNHLHHLLNTSINKSLTIIIYFLLMIAPIIVFKLKILNILNSILLGLTLYLITLIFLYLKNNNFKNE